MLKREERSLTKTTGKSRPDLTPLTLEETGLQEKKRLVRINRQTQAINQTDVDHRVLPKDRLMHLKKLINPLAFLIALVFLLSACGNRVHSADTKEINPEGWSFYDTASFDVEVKDTLTTYDFYVVFDISKNYDYSNLILFLEGKGPEGIHSTDTMECFVAYPDGRWTGNSFGSEVGNKFLFKKKSAFPKKGDYRFSFYHAMRDTVLENITNLGLIIEHSKP